MRARHAIDRGRAFGVLIVLFAITRLLWLNEVLLFAAGVCMVMVASMLSSLAQLSAPNEMRGRVMSIYMVAFRGGMPLGSLATVQLRAGGTSRGHGGFRSIGIAWAPPMVQIDSIPQSSAALGATAGSLARMSIVPSLPQLSRTSARPRPRSRGISRLRTFRTTGCG